MTVTGRAPRLAKAGELSAADHSEIGHHDVDQHFGSTSPSGNRFRESDFAWCARRWRKLIDRFEEINSVALDTPSIQNARMMGTCNEC